MEAGQPKGPVDNAGLQALVNSGTINGDTLVAQENTDNWVPLRTYTQFTIPPAASAPPPGFSGSTQPGSAAVPPSMVPPDAADIEQNKIYAILAYLGPLFLVPLLAAPQSKFARYHANQGIVLFLATVVGMVGSFILMMVPLVACLVSVFPFVIGLAAFFFMILGIVNAAQGETKPLPLIGQYRILSVLLVTGVVVLSSACQSSSPATPPRGALFTVGTDKDGKLAVRDKFTLGETPRVVLDGYANRDVVLELWRNGRMLAGKPVRVPAAKTYKQNEGVVFQENFGGMRPVKRTRLVTIAESSLPLQGLRVGFYQIILKVNDAPVENAKFSVLGQ